ncbi:MAG: hypothetical protein CL928_00875 [Deltaproteobacteria bacterium]|nr:hypothetical protein [Deltaproteobacteria bacterium]
MPHQVAINYDDFFEFLEDYRSTLSLGQYTIPSDKPLKVGDDVVISLSVPVLSETLELHGRVIAPMEGRAGVELDASQGDGMQKLESFYRLVGRLVESMLTSGRFQVAGQWMPGMAPQAGTPAAALGVVSGAEAPGADAHAQEQALGVPTMQGEVNEKSMTDLMMQLYRRREQGILEIISEQGRRLGYVKAGGFVQWRCDPVLQEECLGVLLAQAGKITEEQLRQSLATMNETGQKQGQCLIDSGALTFPQLVMSLMTQVEIVTRNVFRVGVGDYSFYPQQRLTEEFINPPMKAPGYLFGYYKRRYATMPADQVEARYTPLLDQYTILAEGIDWDDLRMKKGEKALVEILGNKSYRFREIFSVSSMGRNPTLQALMALLELGALEFTDTEDVDQVQERWRKALSVKLNNQREQNTFDILEVHWTGRTAHVQEAYDRMKAEYTQFAKGAKLPKELDDMRNEILKNVDAAYALLKDAAGRQAERKKYFEPQQHEVNADLLFKQGEMLMVRHEWDQVIDDFERAIELMPNEPKYRKFLKDAQMRSKGGVPIDD